VSPPTPVVTQRRRKPLCRVRLIQVFQPTCLFRLISREARGASQREAWLQTPHHRPTFHYAVETLLNARPFLRMSGILCLNLTLIPSIRIFLPSHKSLSCCNRHNKLHPQLTITSTPPPTTSSNLPPTGSPMRPNHPPTNQKSNIDINEVSHHPASFSLFFDVFVFKIQI